MARFFIDRPVFAIVVSLVILIAAIYLYEESPVPIIPAAVIYATEAIALVVNAV